MSRLSQSSSSSHEDACGTEEEKTSPVDLCHLDDVDTEAIDVSESAVAMVTSVASSSGSRCYRCRICGEDFGDKSTMFLHLRDMHSAAEKGYKCESCYKSFPSSQQLTQHSLVHTNVRRYRCQYCDKAFKQLSHVQQHERIHTGELPYHCPISSCERSFRQLSSMKQHLKGHCPTITPSNFSSALSPSSFFEAGTSLSPKFTGDMVILQEEDEESPHTTTSMRHEAPDSSCGSSAVSLAAAAYSSESENMVESSHAREEEEQEMPVKRKKEETTEEKTTKEKRTEEKTGCVTPLYQQSLIDLSSKLGEIKRRQRRLRLQETILP